MEENKNTEVVQQAEETQEETKPISKKQARINEIQEKAEKTDLVFDGTPNEKEYRSFLLYNAYTSPMGIFTAFVGVLCIVLFVVRGNSMLTLNSYTLLFVGLVMLTGYPFFMIFQAKWRAHDKKAMKIRYTFLIDGVKMNDVEPKDRDIAMVFQNYALYPHMTVYENMAFALTLRKVPKDEIDRKVREAAKILDLEKLLDRKPKALSGGQRQRVAMGRAIVRSPKVFLMDEPLSNLDAKLRVQMRTEISKLHETLGTTIIYVTHDQTEAMTLGTRIVVMKDGIVQQINTPEHLYNKPCNLFVAGFIGSPQMNFIDAVVGRDGDNVTLTVGENVLTVPEDEKQILLDGDYVGKTVVLGIRPENISDKEDFLAKNQDHIIKSRIKVREMLGAEIFLYFDVNGVQMTARVEPDSPLMTGDEATFALDMRKIHLFDKETEKNLLHGE